MFVLCEIGDVIFMIRETYLCVWCPKEHKFNSIVGCGDCPQCDIMKSQFHGKVKIACNFFPSEVVLPVSVKKSGE